MKPPTSYKTVCLERRPHEK